MGEEKFLTVGHDLRLEGRNRLTLSGVTDVESFDEMAAVLETGMGTLVVRGSGLHVEQLDLEAGAVKLTGEVDSLTYENSAPQQGSFLGRLFR